jgi:hypothetical protein
LVHSPTLEQHVLDMAEVLEIFRQRKLFANSSKCEFRRQVLGFLVIVFPRRACRSTRAKCSP